MRYISKLILAVTMITIVGGSYALFIRDSNTPVDGYCAKRKGFLSNEEFIQLAVRQSLKDPPQLRPDIEGSEASIVNFSQEHPGCCSVAKARRRGLWGDYLSTSVVMEIKTKEKDPSRKNPSEYTTWTVLRECGELVLHSGGG